jgi:hypothetical protein
MKDEALKLADEILLCTTDPLHSKTSAMIRKLVEELDRQSAQLEYYLLQIKRHTDKIDELESQTKPLSDEEIDDYTKAYFNIHPEAKLSEQFRIKLYELQEFARAIEERHGIK